MSEGRFTESVVEEAALAWLESMGYLVLSGPEIAPGEPAAEREDYGQVVLEGRLRQALQRLNPQVPANALEEALRKLTRLEFPSVVRNNHALHRMLVEGVPVEMERAGLPAPRPGLFFVYAILCDDDSIYIGQTEDIEKRWNLHRTGQAAEHTKKHRHI
jgi:type I site-specific restriction-modification system R (restriction) subunit